MSIYAMIGWVMCTVMAVVNLLGGFTVHATAYIAASWVILALAPRRSTAPTRGRTEEGE